MHPLSLIISKFVPGVSIAAPTALAIAAGSVLTAGAVACPKSCPNSAPVAPTAPTPVIAPVAPVPSVAPVAPFVVERVSWHPGDEPHTAENNWGQSWVNDNHQKTVQIIEKADDNRKIKIKIADGDIVAWLNGNKLNADRVSFDENGKIVITDKHGDVTDVFNTGRLPGVQADNVMVFKDGGDFFELAQDQKDERRVVEGLRTTRRGPVRIGITFSEPGDALAYQLGIEPNKAVVITGLDKKFPAAMAGLKENDVIVSLGGSKDGSERSIRAELSKRGPGDEIQVKVLRRGEPKSYTLSLVGPDGKAPVKGRVIYDDDKKFPQAQARMEIERALDEARRAMDEARMGQDVRAEIERALALAQRQSAQGLALAAPRGGFVFEREGNRPLAFMNNNNEELLEMFEEQMSEMDDSMEDRLDELTDRLDELNDRLDALTDAIEELADNLH
ncbi:MAG: PDZ domain-containing protein [Planctomycetota bacterium]